MYKVWIDKSNKRIRFLRISVMCVTIFIPVLITLIRIFKRPKHKRQQPLTVVTKININLLKNMNHTVLKIEGSFKSRLSIFQSILV